MSILKQILAYIIWIVIALLSGIGYMRILFGVEKKSSTGFLHLFGSFYDLALFYLGLIVGSIVALLYILIDIFYLKKKLKNNIKSTIIRLFILLLIPVVIGLVYYISEKIVAII